MTRIRVPTNWQPILLSVESPAVIKQSWSCNAFGLLRRIILIELCSHDFEKISVWFRIYHFDWLASHHLKCECCFDGCCTYYTLYTSMLVWVSYTRWDEVFQVPLEYVTFAAVVLSLVQPVETCPYLSSIRPEKYCICCSFFFIFMSVSGLMLVEFVFFVLQCCSQWQQSINPVWCLVICRQVL